MRTLVLLFCLLFFQLSSGAWLHSMEEAQRQAISSNRFIVVDFWAIWCGPCKKMDVDAWSAPQVRELLDNKFVSVKINIDNERQLAEQYNVKAIPFVLIIDPNGKILTSVEGYRNASGLLKEIQKFAMSTHPITEDIARFKANFGFETASHLAQRYFDYALSADESVRGSLLRVARDYITDAKKTIDKSGPSAPIQRERINFLVISALAYSNQLEKVEKKLSKIEAQSVHEANLNYYYFLSYLVARKNKSGVEAIEAKFPELKDFDSFRAQTELILKS